MKGIWKIVGTAVIVSAVFCRATCLRASLVEDLASPSQEGRDAAARKLRDTYIAPPRTNWDKLVKSLELGMPATLIAKRFQASNFVAQAGSISGNLNVQYRLDGLWVIDTWFTNSYSNEGSIKEEKQEPSQATPVSPVSFINRALSRVELQERLRDMWIEPPTNFTGVWKTYWVNGYPHYQIQYKNGHYDGEFTSFYPDGSKAVVQHYSNGVAEGEDMGFYRSGRVNYKGQYKADRQVGHWTWYKEDGSVESEKDYDSK